MDINQKFDIIKRYLNDFPDRLSSKKLKKLLDQGSFSDIESDLKAKFIAGREEKAPPSPSTIPDDAVSLVMQYFFGTDVDRIEQIKIEHQQSMIAEGVIGDLLERYLASILENHGWVWCSGNFIKAIDFIKPRNEIWIELQVKNRNNTENSSSSAVRDGTVIDKWNRSHSKKPIFFWDNFPDESVRSSLSEEGFRRFVTDYICRVRPV